VQQQEGTCLSKTLFIFWGTHTLYRDIVVLHDTLPVHPVYLTTRYRNTIVPDSMLQEHQCSDNMLQGHQCAW